jgi:ADP-ribosylglycohydrolase
MRICPVGLIHPNNPAAAIQEAAEACRPSHFTDVAVSAAAAVAGAVAAALRPGIGLEEIIEVGRRSAEEGRALGSPWFGASIPRRIDLALDLVRPADPEKPGELLSCIRDLYDLVGSTLAAADSVPCAFAILRLAQGDPFLCASYAAALSGDADTIGAMACAIAGAWKGAAAFPDELIATLRRTNPELDFEGLAHGLTELAEREDGGVRE